MSGVTAHLNYLSSSELKPRYFLYRTEGDQPPRPETRSIAVDVVDARTLSGLSLDVEGIELVAQSSKVADFYDAEEVRRIYFPEVESFVLKHLGAQRVHVFDHNVRNRDRRGEDGVDGPVKFVHNDYTEASGPQRVRDLLGADAPALLKRRFAIVNLWRSIRGAVEESPLGVCDARTMRSHEFVSTDLVYPDRTGEVYSVCHAAAHRWLYFPAMNEREVMLLKCYDSTLDGRARFTAHSAFTDPRSPPEPAPRESIEVRALVFF
tara:strand:+ start:26 stop:817 length:792 start_codon:yes stop_codon:yes gene_type:complete